MSYRIGKHACGGKKKKKKKGKYDLWLLRLEQIPCNTSNNVSYYCLKALLLKPCLLIAYLPIKILVNAIMTWCLYEAINEIYNMITTLSIV